MNHLPFEDWLLNDEVLSVMQKRELDSHLRECATCSTLAETGLVLRSAKVVAPVPGFAARFEQRLAAQRVLERRRRLIGLFVFVLAAAGLITFAGGSTLLSMVNSPAEWLTAGISYLLYIVTSAQVFFEMGYVLLSVLPRFIPPFAWMVIISAMGGVSLLWTISIWRFTSRAQGVTA